MRMPPVALPVELLRDIFEQVGDSQSLSLLALVCKVFHFEAGRILYQAPKNLNPIRHIKFLRSLVHDPRLASFVRSYSLPLMVGRHRITCWELLRITLPAMSNLKELSIVACASDLCILPMHKLTCQIENLSWITIDCAKNEQFEKWIETQEAMKHLRWIHREPIEVSRDAFPNLVSLEGNLHVVEALLPGRKIQRLHWIADAVRGEFDAASHSQKLSQELRNLKSLSFENRFNAIAYNAFANHLTSLTFLELIGYCHKRYGPTVHIPPSLQILVFSFGPALSHEAIIPIDERPDIVAELFEGAINLFRVDIAEKKVTKNVVLYERWEKGARKEDLVHSDEVHKSCIMFSATSY